MTSSRIPSPGAAQITQWSTGLSRESKLLNNYGMRDLVLWEKIPLFIFAGIILNRIFTELNLNS